MPCCHSRYMLHTLKNNEWLKELLYVSNHFVCWKWKIFKGWKKFLKVVPEITVNGPVRSWELWSAKSKIWGFLELDENERQGTPNPLQLQSLRMCLVSLPEPNRNSAWSTKAVGRCNKSSPYRNSSHAGFGRVINAQDSWKLHSKTLRALSLT